MRAIAMRITVETPAFIERALLAFPFFCVNPAQAVDNLPSN